MTVQPHANRVIFCCTKTSIKLCEKMHITIRSTIFSNHWQFFCRKEKKIRKTMLSKRILFFNLILIIFHDSCKWFKLYFKNTNSCSEILICTNAWLSLSNSGYQPLNLTVALFPQWSASFTITKNNCYITRLQCWRHCYHGDYYIHHRTCAIPVCVHFRQPISMTNSDVCSQS